MSSWLAALGPCASPKSKSKERKNDNSLGKPLNLSSLKRRGSLTDIRNTRKVTGSRSFREKIHNTFDGSLRRAKKAGSLEAVGPDARSTTFGNPDTNMNVATSLSPKTQRGNNSDSAAFGNQDQAAVKDKFWTNFYNTLPRNRHKSDRPQDLSLQDLPVTERDSEVDIPNSSSKEVEMELKPAQSDGQWQVYATSPRTKRKNKTLERMNSAPSTRKSPMLKAYEIENRAGSEGTASPQIIDTPEGFEHMTSAGGFVIMPRSVSLQEEYWMPSTKGGSRVELRRVTPSPDRLMIRHSPVGNPMHIQGHVWVKSKDGSHMELHAIERHPREIPSPSDSQKTDLSSLSYSTAASSLSNFVSEDSLPQGYASSTTQTSDQLPYMSPEEYQANIFELIQSLNQSPPNPASPEIKRSKEVRQSRSPSDMKQMPAGNTDDSRTFHSEKFIVLGNTAEDQGSRSDDYVKREQPIFSVRAHVFQIDPETKKNWLPASKSAVAVSYYYDSARNTYRIISVEGSKAIINSTITPNMAFTKTSQKFGQWSDPRANTVYGLGFGTEADLAKFIEKFKDVKELTRQVNHSPQSPTTVNGTSDESHSSSNTPRETPPSRGFFHTRSSSLTSMREPTQPAEQKESVNLRERRNSFNTPGSNGTTANNSPENQLKYENDRLKLALAQSSANAKKWEIELQTLKNNNARLTAALQESTANVEEWKKQLAGYKDETSRMKKKIVELEKKQNNPDQVSALQTDVSQLNERVEGLQRDNQYKDEEVDRLQQRLAEMTTRETANGNLQNKFKAMEEENRGLQQQVRDLQQLVQDNQGSHESEKDELLQLQDHLGSKITELYEFHEQIIATIRKESTS